MPVNIRILQAAHPSVGGYKLAIRDSWSFKVRHVNINEWQKNMYLKQIGNTILFDHEFFEWLKRATKEYYQQSEKVVSN